MRSCAAGGHPLHKDRAWTVAQRDVWCGVVHFIGKLAEALREGFQRPDGMCARIDGGVNPPPWRVLCVFPCRLWTNCVLAVPNRRSHTEPKRALAGGRFS